MTDGDYQATGGEAMFSHDTVFLFTRFGLGHAPAELQQRLADTFLRLLVQVGGETPRLLFYAEGVRLVCEGSPVLEQLQALEAKGAELIICQTCLDYFGLREQVRVGIIGGMGDIVEALAQAGKVISL
jgi:sulfur relay (sulfurtransferase) complex TusBCD TusD component (DsrE family)